MKVCLSKAVRQSIEECFATDQDLLDQWHIESGNGLENCVDRTMRDVAKFDHSFKFFTVHEGNSLVGYWGIEFGQYINLIFVKPGFRTKDFMAKFWDEIKKSVCEPFYTAVYSKNIPAIRFYGKLGKELGSIRIEGNPAILFEFNKESESLCQRAV